MRRSAEHNLAFPRLGKFCLKEINLLVFELRGSKQRNRQTNNLKPGKMSFVSWNQPRSSEICDISVEFVQGVIERCTDILTTSYWLHVSKKILCKKVK
jgi:hypothetical protein